MWWRAELGGHHHCTGILWRQISRNAPEYSPLDNLILLLQFLDSAHNRGGGVTCTALLTQLTPQTPTLTRSSPLELQTKRHDDLRIYADQPGLMTFASVSQFHVYLLWVNACSVLNVEALVGQERALVGAFSVIVIILSFWTFVWSSNHHVGGTHRSRGRGHWSVGGIMFLVVFVCRYHWWLGG